MIDLLLHNPLCWLMLGVAWFAYQQIGMLYLSRHALQHRAQEGQESAAERQQQLPSVLVSALPLMGLLGTIIGLQGSFTGMMTEGADSQIVSGGIADALFTTQLGLVLAIPGWISIMLVKAILGRPLRGAKHV